MGQTYVSYCDKVGELLAAFGTRESECCCCSDCSADVSFRHLKRGSTIEGTENSLMRGNSVEQSVALQLPQRLVRAWPPDFTTTRTTILSTPHSFPPIQTRDTSRAFPSKGIVHSRNLGFNLWNFRFHGVNSNPSLRPIAEHILCQVAHHVLHHPIMINLSSILTSWELLVEDQGLPGFHQNTDTQTRGEMWGS